MGTAEPLFAGIPANPIFLADVCDMLTATEIQRPAWGRAEEGDRAMTKTSRVGHTLDEYFLGSRREELAARASDREGASGSGIKR